MPGTALEKSPRQWKAKTEMTGGDSNGGMHQIPALGIPVFMKEDLLPIMGEEQMIQELPTAFHKVLEEQAKWQR